MIYQIADEALGRTYIGTIADKGACADLLSIALYHTILSLGIFLPNASESDIDKISVISHMIDASGPNGHAIEEAIQHQLDQILDTKTEEWYQNMIEQLVQEYLHEQDREYDSLSREEIEDLERKAGADIEDFYKKDLEDYQRGIIKYPPSELMDYADEISTEANQYMNEAFHYAFAKIANKISNMDEDSRDSLRELMIQYLSGLGMFKSSHQKLQVASQDPKTGFFPKFVIAEFAEVPESIDPALAAKVDECFH